MQYWIAAFGAALVVVIGSAAGPLGAVISLIAFSTTLFLLWAYKLGFMGAWTQFGLDRFTTHFVGGENWDRFALVFGDSEKLGKACTVTVVLIALWLTLPIHQFGVALVAVTAWSIYQSRRGRN
jgi:hypothetical protein